MTFDALLKNNKVFCMIKNILPKSPIAAAGVGILLGAGIGGIKGWLGVRRGDTTQKEAVAGAIKQGLMFGGVAAVSTLASGSKGGGAGLATMAVMGLSHGGNALPAMLMGMTGGRGGGAGMGAGGMGAGNMDFNSIIKTGGGQGSQGGRTGQRGQGGFSGQGGQGGQAGKNRQNSSPGSNTTMSGLSSSSSILDTISNAVADMIIPDAGKDIASTTQIISEPEVLQAEVTKKVEPIVQSVAVDPEGDAEAMHEESATLLDQTTLAAETDQVELTDQSEPTDQAELAGRTELVEQAELADQIEPEDQEETEELRAKKLDPKEPMQGK